MQPPQLPATPGQHASQKPPVQSQLPPVLLVKAESTHPAAGLPLLEDKERLLKYGKWAGLAFLGLWILSAAFGEGSTAADNSTATPSSYEGSYEDRMNAGIAELGGTYDAPSGTMSTNR